MYESLVNLDELTSGVAMLAWLLTGYRAARVAFRPTDATRRRSARVLLGLLTLDAALLVAKLGPVGLLWATSGWDFAENRVLVQLPVLLAGVLPAFVLAGRRLVPMTRRGRPGPDRRTAADPSLVASIQTASVAAVLTFWVAFVTRPVPPYVGDLLFFAALLAVGAVLVGLRQRRRAAVLGRPQTRLPGPIRRVARGAGTTAALLALGVAGLVTASQASVLPGTYPMMGTHGATTAHGTSHGAMAMAGAGSTDVSSLRGRALTGPVDGVPDRRFTMTAAPTTQRLASGATVEAWAFNGQLPGPELRVRQGELVEVTLLNHLGGRGSSGPGVTLHWHGVDVANAADGVAGLTQDAVPPRGRYVYRFRAPDVGTYWYHSHQQSSEQVERGLFGSLVVMPPDAAVDPPPGERTVVAHTWTTAAGRQRTLGAVDGRGRDTVPSGTPVRLRMVNTDNSTMTVTVAGTPFRVAAVDGHEVNEPTELRERTVRVAAGGRDDLTFTMPEGPVLLAGVGFDTGPRLLLTPDGTGDAPPPNPGPEVDMLGYGTPAPTPFDARTPVDRDLRMILDDGPGFHDGTFGFLSTINGATFPDTPMPMVREGDLVRTTFVNRSHSPHPMHLHGHHVLVRARNGEPATGSPWWADTLEVRPGETFTVAFRADNPGLWMDHCHNLSHAATGMTMHLGYEGVTSSLLAGRATTNQPE